MRILSALRTSYAPFAKSGADVMCERVNSFLASKGHEVITIIENCPRDYHYKGVLVTSNTKFLGEKYDWCDIVITNLVIKGEAVMLAKRFNKPIFHLVHNSAACNIAPNTPDNYLIFNSYNLNRICNYGMPSLVVNPPTWVSDWQNGIDHFHNQYVTLVNCVKNKGHETLEQLALNMPNMQFMGVKGGYGAQGWRVLKNLTYEPFKEGERITGHGNDIAGQLDAQPAQPAIKEIYDKTKIIIVPSISETWSLVAAEAQANGIPVVCSDLPGLRENLSDSALYATGTRAYVDAILRLHNKWEYDKFVERGLQQQKNNEVSITSQLENLNSYMEQVVKEKKEQSAPVKEKVSYAERLAQSEKKIINQPGSPVTAIKTK